MLSVKSSLRLRIFANFPKYATGKFISLVSGGILRKPFAICAITNEMRCYDSIGNLPRNIFLLSRV